MADRYTPCARALFTELGDGTGVLLHLDSKFYYTLNQTGTEVWKALQQGMDDIEAMTSRLTSRFAVDHGTAAADIVAMLAFLAAEGLVEKKAAEASDRPEPG
jgi:uncharacterized membrane-anchored protein